MHNGYQPKPETAIRMALKLAEETWNTRQRMNAMVGRGRSNQMGEVWKKPGYGMVKVNTDASWVASTKKGGTGVVARYCEGRIIAERNTTRKHVSAKNLEAKAIYQAVELVVSHQWGEVTIESDAQQIIKMIHEKKPNLDWELKNILEDILELANKIPTIHWKFVRRSVNRCAKWISRMSRQGTCPFNWTIIHLLLYFLYVC